MFDNIGSKIKILAKVICWLGIIASVIVGIVMMANGAGQGLLILILGSLFSWIGSFFAYGFGELIEKVTVIADQTPKGSSEIKSSETKLATLNSLRDKGLITDEEFEERKKDLR